MNEELQQIDAMKDKLTIYFVENGVRIAIAIGIIVVGFWLAKVFAGMILRVCDKRMIDITLARFFAGLDRKSVV